MLAKRYSLRLHRPRCTPDADWLSAFGLVSVDLSPVIPYLNAVIKGAIYSSRIPSLTFYHDGHMMTVQPRQIGASKCRDEQQARELLDWLLNLINDTWERREQLQPRYEEVPPLTVLDVYRLLPGTNCAQCGEPTCMAFAAALIPSTKSISDCKPLFENDRFAEKAEKLIETLVSHGYEVPTQAM